MEKIVTDQNFIETLRTDRLVMVDFWAPWCGPCRMLGPVVAELAEEYEGKVLVGKCNVDDNQIVPSQLGIMSIPAVFFFKDGKAVGSSVGYRPKEDLKKMIDSLL
ncbi:MAG: thioredoxin [Bacteroidales bacterium]|nr:thioredoxin [Bacteroidales bacterium]